MGHHSYDNIATPGRVRRGQGSPESERTMGRLTASIILDDRLNIMEAGKGCEAFLGVAPELCRERLLEDVAPGLFALTRDLISKAAKGRAVENYAIPYKVEGRMAQVLVSAIPYPLSTLGINGVLVTFSTDLGGESAQETAEPAGETVEQPALFPRMEALAYLAEGVFLADLRGIISYANPAFAELTGYTAAGLEGRAFEGLLTESYEKAAWERVLDMVRLSNWEGELQLASAAGQVIPVLISLSAVHDSVGGPLGVAAVVRDMRGAHALQAEKEMSLGRLWSLVDNSPAALICFTPDFRVTLWNGTAAGLWGWSADRVIGSDLFQLIDAGDREFLEGAVRESGSQLYRGGIEIQALSANGESLSLRFKAARLEAGGASREWLLLVEKASEPGAASGAPASVSREGRERLREAELELSALRGSQEARGELTRLAAKELRDPLTSLKAGAVLLRDNLDKFSPGEARALLEHMNGASEQIAILVQEIAHIPVAESVPRRLRQQRIRLPELVSEVLHSMDIPEERYRVIANFSEGFPELATDPDKLKQVLFRLLDNAVQYSPEGGYIGLSARVMGESALISVKDRGEGMATLDRKYAFRRLHVLPELDPLGVDGLKLGLYLCKRYVSELGGELWAESEPGTGTTVHFTLPLHADEA